MSKSDFPTADKLEDKLNRRELISKYGPYTAPLVMTMLVPGEAYAANAGTIYSTSQACVDASGHSATMVSHCMVNGRAGGMSTHTVINPGPAS